jgi:hypothetical protein
MTSFELITDQDFSAFAATVARNGWKTSDFELQEESFDQATAEVEARKGQVGVRCLLTQAVTIYPLGDGSDWVATFAADLEHRKFGQPSGL